MKKGKITLECSCGNSKAWLIMADVVPSAKVFIQYKYWLQCYECGAKKTLAIRDRA